jgi:hypothetical protein
MAVKIKLGARPKNYKRVVKFPLLEGGEGAVECVFKYRTKTEFGQFIDAIVAGAKVKPALDEDGRVSMADLMEKTSGANADYLLQVLDGWNLDEELSVQTLQQLANEFPGAGAAIREHSRAADTAARPGN